MKIRTRIAQLRTVVVEIVVVVAVVVPVAIQLPVLWLMHCRSFGVGFVALVQPVVVAVAAVGIVAEFALVPTVVEIVVVERVEQIDLASAVAAADACYERPRPQIVD